MRNFDLWSGSIRHYLANLREFRRIIKKIFSKVVEFMDFTNTFLDDTKLYYYEEKKSNLLAFCVTNNNKDNFFITLKYYYRLILQIIDRLI